MPNIYTNDASPLSEKTTCHDPQKERSISWAFLKGDTEYCNSITRSSRILNKEESPNYSCCVGTRG